MIVTNKSDHPTTDAAAKKATGKSWKQWFDKLDKFGGPKEGRRAMVNHLYKECNVDPWWSSTIVIQYEAARNVVKKDGRAQGYMICATKSIKASAADAYAAFTDPKKLNKWFGPKNKIDLTDGGRFSNADGNCGVIKKIRPAKALKFTWEQNGPVAETVVEVTIQSKGDAKCGVIVAHDRIQTRPEADGLRNAWGAALDTLKSVLE